MFGRKHIQRIYSVTILIAVIGVSSSLRDGQWATASSTFDALGGTAYAQSKPSEAKGAKAAPVSGSGESEKLLSGEDWLKNLERREKELKRAEAALEKRRLLLETLKKDNEVQLKRLEAVRTELVEYTKKANAARKKQIAKLVLSLESTKPEIAAPIFTSVAEMDVDLAVELLMLMQDKDAGKIIDAMLEPETMVKIITKMSKIPGAGALNGRQPSSK